MISFGERSESDLIRHSGGIIGASIPDAAADHHRVVERLRQRDVFVFELPAEDVTNFGKQSATAICDSFEAEIEPVIAESQLVGNAR